MEFLTLFLKEMCHKQKVICNFLSIVSNYIKKKKKKKEENKSDLMTTSRGLMQAAHRCFSCHCLNVQIRQIILK